MSATLLLATFAVTVAPDFQIVLDRIRQQQEVPGASVVISGGDRMIFAGASGVADIETGRTMTADTLLYSGSLSKIFTAILTLQLAEEENDAETMNSVVADLDGFEEELEKHEFRRMFSGEMDANDGTLRPSTTRAR